MVVDSTGKPIDNVDVGITPPRGKLRYEQPPGPDKNSVANQNGRFSMEDLRGGTHTLTPSKVGYTFAPSSISINATSSQKYQLFVAQDSGGTSRRGDMSHIRRKLKYRSFSQMAGR
jgi:hypothetical protein